MATHIVVVEFTKKRMRASELTARDDHDAQRQAIRYVNRFNINNVVGFHVIARTANGYFPLPKHLKGYSRY